MNPNIPVVDPDLQQGREGGGGGGGKGDGGPFGFHFGLKIRDFLAPLPRTPLQDPLLNSTVKARKPEIKLSSRRTSRDTKLPS